MRYIDVIHQAWDITTSSPKLKWFAFVPSFVGVIVFMAEVAWQLSLYSTEFGFVESGTIWDGVKLGFSFVAEHEVLWWVAPIILFFILIFAYVLPAWVSATLILGVKQRLAEPGKYLSIRQKMIDGFGHFFTLFELNALLAPLAFITISIFTATMYRYYHDSLFSFMLPIIVIYSIFSVIVNTFCSFTHYYVVCENAGVKESIRKSSGLVFLNVGRTLAIILLMVLVNLRIILNVLVIFGVPMGIVAAVSVFATSAWLKFAVFLAVLAGLVMISLAAYLTAIVEVFSTAVWLKSFQVLRQEQDLLADEHASEEIAAP